METNPSPQETESPRRRHHRRGIERHPHGRAWVAALLLILRLGDLPLVWLAFRRTDPDPQLFIPVLISVLWTTALCAALWMKQVWSRYVTAAFLGLCLCWWGYDATTQAMHPPAEELLIAKERLVFALIATGAYVVGALMVLRSKDIRYLTDPAAGFKPRKF